MRVNKEIRDPLHGVISLTAPEVKILDHPFLQRLRLIKQLDFMDFIFPGATHTRFLHSLGSFHLASLTFDHIFKTFSFCSKDTQERLRTTFKLAALLHDIGHGPLSHATEKAMPPFSSLWKNLPHFLHHKSFSHFQSQKASHEDYTIKMIVDSHLTEGLAQAFPDLDPLCIAGIIDSRIKCSQDFFMDGGVNFRPILHQLISSEIDVDRMDYLGRDAYFCGVHVSRMEWSWLISNMTHYETEGSLYLALYRKALPAFEQFLLTRHYMRLMVYFHPKNIIYKEILDRFLSSSQDSFVLPSDIQTYVHYTDVTLNECLKLKAQDGNAWAQQIVRKAPHKLLFEGFPKAHQKSFDSLSNPLFEEKLSLKTKADSSLIERLYKQLKKEGFHLILSHPFLHFDDIPYLSSSPFKRIPDTSLPPLFLIDPYNPSQKPHHIETERSIQFFKNYEEIRHFKRLYVLPEEFAAAHLQKEKMIGSQ